MASSERYQHDGISPFLLCTHCGCAVWDRELHDRVNGLGYLDEGNAAMVSHMQAIGQQLPPPEPPA